MRKLLWLLVIVAAAGAGYLYFTKPHAIVQDPVAQGGIEPSTAPSAKPSTPGTAPVVVGDAASAAGSVPAAVPVAVPASEAAAAPVAAATAPASATTAAAPAAPATGQKQAEGVAIDGAPTIGGPFTLTDQNGTVVSDKTYAGKYLLVFFGFTNCPSICPTALTNITGTLKVLGADADKIVPIFITVDPSRDQPAALKTYLQNFDPRIVALTGTQEQIDNVTKEYKVYAKKVEVPGMNGYMMDHSTFLYLMDKDGKYLAHLEHNEPADQMAVKIRPFITQ
ncbi:MAG: SCO family protein [Proteobacteria bacterium]|nr:SCO family protein [Pseudomonadota bacterium]